MAIAVACIQVEHRPWAAAPYLHVLRNEFADLTEAPWAALMLREIERRARTPLPGRVRELRMPGQGVAKP